MTNHLLSADQALLVVIDIQEKFESILFNAHAVVENTRRLITGCNQLDVPVIVTEQYPKGLGRTVQTLQNALKKETPVLEKTSFGCAGDPAIAEQIQASNRNQIIVCGLEAHVCVNQTTVSLLEQGYRVYLVEDAIGARSQGNYDIAMRKLSQLGAIPSCVEMVLFELMRSSRHPQFKAVQQLIL